MYNIGDKLKRLFKEGGIIESYDISLEIHHLYSMLIF